MDEMRGYVWGDDGTYVQDSSSLVEIDICLSQSLTFFMILDHHHQFVIALQFVCNLSMHQKIPFDNEYSIVSNILGAL